MMNKDDKTIFYMENIYILKNDIYKIIISVINDHMIAEDLTQIVFEKAWRKMDTLKDKDKTKQWVKAIVRNEIRIHLKKDTRKKNFIEEVDASEYVNSEQIKKAEKDILDILIEQENCKLILQALKLLDEKYKEVLILNLIMEIPLKDIAEIFGANYGSTRVLYSRALKKLRSKYEELEKEGGER